MIRILNILTVHAIISARVAFAVGNFVFEGGGSGGGGVGGGDEQIAYNLA